jgi:hypothetical protein
MNERKRLRPVLAGIIALGFIISGCATTDVADTIPDEVQRTFDVVDRERVIALSVALHPDGEQVYINLGSIDYTLNRLFAGMMTQMVQTKFRGVDRRAEDRLAVTVSYLNLEERPYGGGSYLSRIDMTVAAALSADGVPPVAEEFSHSAFSDVEGYSIRTDQIYGLLLEFVVSIDEFLDAQFAGP